MLRTTIQTTDETGKELPIPADLRAQVQRAAGIVENYLHKLGGRFDIEVSWRFTPEGADELSLGLDVRTANNRHHVSVPLDQLDTEESTRRWLWDPLWVVGEFLSDELDRDIDRGRQSVRSLEESVTAEG